MPDLRLVKTDIETGKPKKTTATSIHDIWKMGPEEFVDLARNRLISSIENKTYKPDKEHSNWLLRNPDRPLNSEDLIFLCDYFGIKESAFILEGSYCDFLTEINQEGIRFYNPSKIGIHTGRTMALFQDPTILVTTNDLRRKLYEFRKANDIQASARYPLVQYLIDTNYGRNESLINKIKKLDDGEIVNDNALLSMYAAALSKKLQLV